MRIFIFFFFIISVIHSQKTSSSLIVHYTHSIELEGAPSTTSINATLISNSNESIYEMDFMGNMNFIDEEDSEGGPVLSIKPTKNPKIFKYLNEQTFYSIERILMRPYLVKDTTNQFKWLLVNDYKTILGYQCQLATIVHRGREYKAYFTTEIPFKLGPWKFDGLPGLILSIESIDGVFKINATKIELKNIKSLIENPFIKELDEAISWSEFTDIYKKKYDELNHYRSPSGGTMSIPKRNIETFIE